MPKSFLLRWSAAALALAAIALPAQAGKTLDAIKARGQLVCGVNTGLAGFSQADSAGNWSGLDVDFCKAIAASILGDEAMHWAILRNALGEAPVPSAFMS